MLFFSSSVFAECIDGDCSNGYGTYYFNNGDKYIGEFKNSQFNGYGSYFYSDGDKYIGEWKNGKYNGQGMHTYDGEIVNGIWRNDKLILRNNKDSTLFLSNKNQVTSTSTKKKTETKKEIKNNITVSELDIKNPRYCLMRNGETRMIPQTTGCGFGKEISLIRFKELNKNYKVAKVETKKNTSTLKDLEKLINNNFQLYYEKVFSLATNSYFCYYDSAYKSEKKTTDFKFLKSLNIDPNEDNPKPLVEFYHSDDFQNVVYAAINENDGYDAFPLNYEIQKNYRDTINQQNTTIKIRKNSYEFEIDSWSYPTQKVKFTPKNNKLIYKLREIKIVHNCIPQDKPSIDQYVKVYPPKASCGDNWTFKKEERSMFGKCWSTDQELGNLKRKSAEKVVYRFVTKKKQLGKDPAIAIRSIAYLEVLYNELLADYSFDKKALNDIKNTVLSFRKSFNFDTEIDVNEAIKRYWVLAYIVENGTSTKKGVSQDLLERKVALHNLKKSIAMVRSFIDYDTSLNKKNQSVKLKENQKLSSLVEEISKILSSFKSYKNEVTPPKSQLAKDIDSAINEYEKTYHFVYDNINNFKKTNKEELLISSAFGLDLLYNLLGEAESKIPNSYKLNLSKIDKKYLKKHKKTLSKLVSDTNSVKLSNYKDTIFYTQQLENVDFNAIGMIQKLDDLDLGLGNINDTLNSVNLNSINIAELNINNVESSIENLNNIDVQSISASVEQSIEQSAQAVQQAVEEAAASIQQMYTLGDAMAEIHDEIAGYTWFEPMSLSEYLESRGVAGIVDSTTSFSDAVDLFNQDQGTNLSDEEALIMMAADVCQSDGMCTHPMLGW